MTETVYFAQKAFIVSDGSLLAVRRDAFDLHHPLKWEVPGGRLEKGEDLDSHIIREVFEETSLHIGPGLPFFVWKWDIRQVDETKPATIVAVARLCTIRGGEMGEANQVPDDHIDLIKWIPIHDFDSHEWIPNMLPVLDALVERIREDQT